MNPHPSASPAAGRGLKRNHDDSTHSAELPYLKPATSDPVSASTHSTSSSSFRNVSACNRCRLRKNRCDQKLPACAACEKANVNCVGYDPITKREIPRSYVYYLESRTSYLETLLKDNGIQYMAPEAFALEQKPTPDRYGTDDTTQGGATPDGRHAPPLRTDYPREMDEKRNKSEREKLDKLVSHIGMVSVQGASDPRYLGSTSGISFARVVFAAVKHSVSNAPPTERGRNKSITSFFGQNSSTMRDSIFGLQNKPTIQEAPFPDRDLGLRLVNLYFEHANPQIPILHRGDFMQLFERGYSLGESRRSARESYMLNIVFAIGAAIIFGTPEKKGTDGDTYDDIAIKYEPPNKMAKLSDQQYQAEEYHASAIIHLESFLGDSPLGDRPDGFGGGLEELQAVLLLASFALLRPVAPGLWYIVGVAVRLGIDLGLHHEQGIGVDENPSHDRRNSYRSENSTVDDKERGRREWVRDLRRRLWWCVYSFDRLVSTCVGRPFGITDQVITTEFPSLLDDRFIKPQGFVTPPPGNEHPTYKLVSHHYFRLRLLQSEIQQVLQYEQTQQSRADGINKNNAFMHTKLPSPFLQRFRSFNEWREDVDHRLWEWKTSAPDEVATAVRYSPMLMELNYWQAVIVLYRQSLTMPPVLAEEVASARDDMSEPSTLRAADRQDDERVFFKVAEAGQKVLKIYRQLHRVGLVNYTYLATHHLFMAGISFLYALWHSTLVRSQITLDDVDFTVLAATSVLEDLVVKCPPAEACKDAFNRMARATIQMCLSTTGFGPQAMYGGPRAVQMPMSVSVGIPENSTFNMMPDFSSQAGSPYSEPAPRTIPRFDMNLRDLFSEDEGQIPPQRRPSHGIGPVTLPLQLHHMDPFQHQSPTPSNISTHTRRTDVNMNTPNMGIDPNLQPLPAGNIQPPLFTNAQPFSNNNNGSMPQHIHSQYPTQDQFNELQLLDAFPAGSSDFIHHDRNLDFFGMGGLDGSHDWRDGNGVDMFDGFFFGAAGT